MRTLSLLLVWSLGFFPFAPAPVWHWPTEGPPVVLRDFLAPATPWGAGHRGLDLHANGTDIVAPVSGTISYSGYVVNRGVLTITTAEGHQVSMEPVTATVSTGDRVSRGEVVATLESGHCVTLCLHIGLRVDGRYRSPRRELGLLQRAILVPW